MAEPFRSSSTPPDVVHEDRDIQPLEPLRDPLKVNPGPARVLQEIPHVLNLSRPPRLGPLDLLDYDLELLLVPSVQDQVEALVVELPGGGLAYSICGAGDDGIRRWALKVFLPAVGRSEEVEPHEIEDCPQFCEAHDETYVVDGGEHGERDAEEVCPADIAVIQWGLNRNTECICDRASSASSTDILRFRSLGALVLGTRRFS